MVGESGAMLSNGIFGGPSGDLSFGPFGNRSANHLRWIARGLVLVYVWWYAPRIAFAKPPAPPKPYSVLDKTGTTQTPGKALRKKIEAREQAEAAKKASEALKTRPDVAVLSDMTLDHLRGGQGSGGGGGFQLPNEPKGEIVQTPTGAPADGGNNGSGTGISLRNPYFAGTMPWHKAFRDVNLCTGNLFKNFTDIQVAPGKGQGLVLSRSYNSNDNHIGPFGIGWTHAYDIRMEDAGIDAEGTEYSPRTDFFGGKHSYTRDADGLYTPPPYLFDELDSRYHAFLVGDFAGVDEDKQVGMDGTIKHFVSEGLYAAGHAKAGFPVPSRVCDYIEDRHGNRTSLTYDTVTLPGGVPKKLLHTVTDPTGRQLVFSWANLGSGSAPAWRIISVASPQYAVAYGYNAEKNLSSVSLDAGGLNRTTTYGYTTAVDGSGNVESGLLASITDPLNHTVTYGYGNVADSLLGTVWVSSVTEPAGETATGTLRSNTWIFDALTWNTDNDNLGVVLQGRVTLPGTRLGVIAQIDGQLRVVKCTGNGDWGGVTRYYYDSSNNIIRTSKVNTGGSGPYLYPTTSIATYGPHGNVLTQRVEGFAGTTTTEYFDASKYFQKKKVTDPAGRVTEFDYYPKAKYTATPNDPVTKGRDGQVMWVRDPGYGNSASTSYGRQFEYDYNAYGQKAWEKNLANVVTTFAYGDAWNNLTEVHQDPTGLNRTTLMSYDGVGKVLTSTDPMGHVSTFGYNALGQPMSASFPANGSVAGETIAYGYGANGRTESVTDNRGTTLMTYENGSDRVKSVTDPVTGTISYTYLATGERKTVTTPAGDTTTYDYAEEPNPPPGTEGFIFDAENPNSVTHNMSRITDAQGRRVDLIWLSQETNCNAVGRLHGFRFNQTFDNNSNLVSYTEQRMDWDREYYVPWDQGNQYSPSLDRVRAVKTVQWTKTQTGWISHLLNENRYIYNQLTGQKTSNQVVDNFNNSRTEVYSYDELSRLKTVNYGDGQSQTYGFDAIGNRTSKADNVTGSEVYGYNAANMLLARNGQNYSNDANGNTLSGGGRSMTWDAQNRMVSCVTGTGSGQKISSFVYGSDGLRRRMTVASANSNPTYTTDYVLDGNNVVQESVTVGNGTPVVAATYLMGPSGPMYKRPSNLADVRWYIYDGGGNVTGEVDPLGNVTAAEKHDVYGAMRSVSGSATSKHGWQGSVGHQSDGETGLVYMRARYYDPIVGRFGSEDSAQDGTNWLAYCDNDPINSHDSDGKRKLTSSERNWKMMGDFAAGTAFIFAAFASMQKVLGRTIAGIYLTMAVISFVAAIFCDAMALGLNDGRGLMFGGGVAGIVVWAATTGGTYLLERFMESAGQLGRFGAAGYASGCAIVSWTAGTYAALYMCERLD